MTSSDRRSFLKGAAGAAAAFAFQPDLSASPRALNAPLRVGLIGAGRQGRAILGELGKFEDITIAAVCDSDARRLSSAKRRAPGAVFYAEHKAMLESEDQLDAVLIATPTHQHRSLCEDSLDAGKHVYCEAPLAHTLEDAKAIARAARAASGKFQTGMAGRANPVYSLARSFVRMGAIRDTLSMRSQFKKKTSWRTPTSDPARDKFLNWRLDPDVSLGLVGEVGTHHFDVLHWFTGQYPTSVRGTGELLAWKDGRKVADTVHCEFQFPGGVRSQWEASLG
ncbi:MAG TPA: Gfo/Idh/MocA family oxidoreductase, partial [Planctomycetota bacterium]|nr:Gfo/Idh/MocA family oxidoreductase [Planctomycetota bacterium]